MINNRASLRVFQTLKATIIIQYFLLQGQTFLNKVFYIFNNSKYMIFEALNIGVRKF